ncbi:MAG TPA: DEAD/DEAH box helicase, partial [Microbacterium sp.]|nr:DEAD/DEAH box helicase [Microbacterium sp.]
MPKNKKPAGGRPAKNFDPRYASKSGGARKPRWNRDDRDQRAHGSAPRDGHAANRDDRRQARFGDQSDRGPRRFDGDRDQARGGRRFEDRGSRRFDGDRGPRRFDDRGDRRQDDRGARRFDDRGERRFQDRGERRFDDRRGEGRGDRRFEDRGPRRFDDRRQDDRGARRFDGDRRQDDRGGRRFDDRGERRFQDRGPRRFDDRGDRGGRRFDDRRQDNRGERRFDGDRRQNDRRFEDRTDRAPRRDDARGERRDSRPQHAGERAWQDRREAAPQRSAQQEERIDVVHERLEASAVAADEVEGQTFADLGLGDNICRALADMGATSPFPIQAATVGPILEGKDVLGRGRTGSGKTIAFGAPLVESLLRARKGGTRAFGRSPQALIIAPTRELALQIDRTVQPIARSVGLFTTQVYGGVPQGKQVGALKKGVDIVIGTPGRIGDLQRQGKLDLSQIAISVLDEADHMCELGFLEPVQEILRLTKADGQKLLFSATLDREVSALVDEFLKDPQVYEVA